MKRARSSVANSASAATRLSRVPTAILAHIFSFLDLLAHTRLVGMAKHYHTAARLPTASPRFVDMTAKPLDAIRHLRPESLVCRPVSAAHVAAIASMTSLRALRIHLIPAGVRLDFGPLSKLRLLNQVDMRFPEECGGDDIGFARHLPLLTRMTTSSRCIHLVSETVRSLSVLSWLDIGRLQHLTALTELRVDIAWDEAEMLRVGRTCPRLTDLEFSVLRWSTAALATPAEFATAFWSLGRLKCSIRDQADNPTRLARLVAAITSLRDLTVVDTSTMSLIGSFPPSLQRLDLSGGWFDDAHVTLVCALRELRTLVLARCRVLADLRRLTDSVALDELDLSDCTGTGAMCLPRLQTLHITLELSVASVELSRQWPNLTRLHASMPLAEAPWYRYAALNPPASLTHFITGQPQLFAGLAARGVIVQRPAPPPADFPLPVLPCAKN